MRIAGAFLAIGFVATCLFVWTFMELDRRGRESLSTVRSDLRTQQRSLRTQIGIMSQSQSKMSAMVVELRASHDRLVAALASLKKDTAESKQTSQENHFMVMDGHVSTREEIGSRLTQIAKTLASIEDRTRSYAAAPADGPQAYRFLRDELRAVIGNITSLRDSGANATELNEAVALLQRTLARERPDAPSISAPNRSASQASELGDAEGEDSLGVGSAEPQTCAGKCCWRRAPDINASEGSFSTFEGYSESLVSPTMFREMSDVVFGWMAELKWWTGQGNYNAEFEADGAVERNTDLEMALECLHPGVVIFVETWVMKEWFHKMHDKIPVPYVLVTGHSDKPCPDRWVNKLEDSKLLHWFGNNPTNRHEKFSPIPLGLNMFYHSVAILSIRKRGLHARPKSKLAVANFFFSHARRKEAWRMLCESSKDFIECRDKRSYLYPAGSELTPQLEKFLPYKFWMSPRGNGLDCHRTWEALYLGSIPVVETSIMDSLYKGLPVLIVPTFKDVTEELLQSTWNEMTENGRLRITDDKLHKAYWRRQIDRHKKQQGRLEIVPAQQGL